MSLRGRLQIAHLDNWLLDAEHGQMVHLIEDMGITATSGKDEPNFGGKFDKLITWTAKHFAHENDHMLQVRFPGAREHIAHHCQLIEKLKGFVTAKNDKNAGAPDAIAFLEDWLIHHIETDDTLLAEFLASKTTR